MIKKNKHMKLEKMNHEFRIKKIIAYMLLCLMFFDGLGFLINDNQEI